MPIVSIGITDSYLKPPNSNLKPPASNERISSTNRHRPRPARRSISDRCPACRPDSARFTRIPRREMRTRRIPRRVCRPGMPRGDGAVRPSRPRIASAATHVFPCRSRIAFLAVPTGFPRRRPNGTSRIHMDRSRRPSTITFPRSECGRGKNAGRVGIMTGVDDSGIHQDRHHAERQLSDNKIHHHSANDIGPKDAEYVAIEQR